MTERNQPDGRDGACERRIVRAGYQGREGSFGARAAARCGRPVALPTFEALLDALAEGTVDEALLPAVDRVIGPVVEALGPLGAAIDGGARLAVLGEIEVPMRLVLAAPRGVALEEIEELHSQLPVLRQCEGLLARLGARAVPAEDTAQAAATVARAGGRRGAVCSEEAALEAGLVPLLEDVSDVRPNGTRFWRLARAGGEGSDQPLRVLRVPTERLAAHLKQSGIEVFSSGPGAGFALVGDALVATAAAAVREAKAQGATWLGTPPDLARRPRVEALPRATEVRPATVVTVGGFRVGGGARAVIAGPCTVESEEQIRRLARAVARAGATALRGGVFKPRTSPYSFQGHGLHALRWLKEAGERVGLPVVTEVMAPAQVGPVAEVADVLQIGARNCQNYDLLKEAGAAGRPILLKRGFGTTVDEWLASAEYLLDAGCEQVMLCERGIRTFEQSTRGTLDLGGLLAARQLTHLPLLADPSHAAGRKELVPGLARAAWGAGVDGLIVEVHDAPESAWCDGPQALLPEDLERLCDEFGLLPGATPSVERVRTAIDAVDREIGRLVARRLELCRRVADAKRAAGVPLRDAAREETVMARYLETPGIDEGSARRLAESLIAMGLTVEGWSAEGAA
ncbi:MAG TPA: 3-deoxy-7-phosphoheptulonate synthase [Thermoanaerobaculia bacterium]|nr:3-deoxy-7-phosphoheptulonate synthase [Thermoanaerobaculia bacterium]HPA53330.1 3-deoxy-7-phosphoheptulonate synthase [Thermoanaerobaculia bacterium]HQN08969.1 3-deoxy-7-phosphoheptulonate synthase [Thermoanaerobaculia bacterium]HQP87874.1 3-deoxy-7-phosphoheptulonate synthase [Thermoanaerobaculia bacterium]